MGIVIDGSPGWDGKVRHGWYSEKMAQLSGTVVYESVGEVPVAAACAGIWPMLEGERHVVTVTEVTDDPTTKNGWPDLLYVGPVGAYVRGALRNKWFPRVT